MVVSKRPALWRWRELSSDARRYLIHVSMLTASVTILGLLLNVAVLAFGYSRTELGRLNTVAVWASVVFSAPLWWLVTRIGLRAALLLHGLLQAIAVTGYVVAPTALGLYMAGGLMGASAVLLQVSAAPLMMRTSNPATRDYLFSLNTALAIGISGVASLGAGALPGVFAHMLGTSSEHPAAYRATLLVAVGGIVLSLVPLLWLTSDPPRQAAQPSQPATPPHQQIRELLRILLHRPLLALLISPTLVSIGAAVLIPYLNLFYKQIFGVSDSELGLIFAILNIATGAAVLLGPQLSARRGTLSTVVLVQLLSIPFLLLAGFVPIVAVAVGAAAIRGALFNMATPLYEAFAMQQTEESLRPLVIGIIGGASTVGYLFGPAISVQVQASYGFGPLFVTTAVCYSLAALANWLLLGSQR